MQFPNPITAYFAADAARDAAGLMAAFAPDAEVQDEGESHRGRETIRLWWLAAKAKYRHTAEPLDMANADGWVIVRARISGDFPGSPAVLSFAFRLAGDQIRDLRIG